MRNPLAHTWRTLAAREGIAMPGSQCVVTLVYRNETTLEEVRWSVPVPAAPDLLRKIEASFAMKGFVRVDEEPTS